MNPNKLRIEAKGNGNEHSLPPLTVSGKMI
jgi:hypothetical protein